MKNVVFWDVTQSLVRSDVSKEFSATFIRVTRICELGTTLQEPRGVTSQKTPFFKLPAYL
jgi:hypothetical protein